MVVREATRRPEERLSYTRLNLISGGGWWGWWGEEGWGVPLVWNYFITAKCSLVDSTRWA